MYILGEKVRDSSGEGAVTTGFRRWGFLVLLGADFFAAQRRVRILSALRLMTKIDV